MNILHISNYYPAVHNHAGGAEYLCKRIIDHSRKAGLKASVLTLPRDFKRGGEEVIPCSTIESCAGKLGRRIIHPLKWYLFQNDPFARKKLRTLLQENRPDVIHFHNFQFLTLSLLAEAKQWEIPSCLSIYDYWYFCPTTALSLPEGTSCRYFHGPHCAKCLPRFMSGLQRSLLAKRKRVFNRYLEDVSAFFVLSNASKGVLEDYGIPPDKICIIPPLYEAPKFPNDGEKRREGLQILFVGWIQERKGLHVLLQALPGILHSFPEAKVTVIGGKVQYGKRYEKKIQAQIHDLGLAPNVEILGHQPQEAVYRELARADVVAVPEQWENMSPVIIVESLFAGKPVVASRLGGIPELVDEGKTGFTFSPGDSDSLAEKICSILGDSTLRKTASVLGPQIAADRFRPEKNIPYYIECYKALLQGRTMEGLGDDGTDRTASRETCVTVGGA